MAEFTGTGKPEKRKRGRRGRPEGRWQRIDTTLPPVAIDYIAALGMGQLNNGLLRLLEAHDPNWRSWTPDKAA